MGSNCITCFLNSTAKNLSLNLHKEKYTRSRIFCQLSNDTKCLRVSLVWWKWKLFQQRQVHLGRFSTLVTSRVNKIRNVVGFNMITYIKRAYCCFRMTTWETLLVSTYLVTGYIRICLWLFQNDNVENLVGFNMFSYRSCKNLWRSCIEHHTFFRLHTPPQVKGSFFSVGSKFRYRWVFLHFGGAL